MAVNINTVYQRVLAIANKEQNGYITPQEFNTFANQAQMEIFEQYFYDINQFGRLHGNSTEYSDMLNIINEKLLPFVRTQKSSFTTSIEPGYLSTYGNTLVTNGTFDSDASSWTGVGDGGSLLYDSAAQNLKLENDGDGNEFECTQNITTVAGTLYRIQATINAGALNTSTSNAAGFATVLFKNISSSKVNAGFSATVEFFVRATSNSTTLKLKITSSNGNTGAADFATFDDVKVQEASSARIYINPEPSYADPNYIGGVNETIYRIGTVMHTDSNGRFVEVDRILPNDLINISSSPLTKPTSKNPVYAAHIDPSFGIRQSLSVFPSSISTELAVNYTVVPRTPIWGYTIVNEKAQYDATSSIDFTLHPSESVTLVNKILELAGISMQKQDIVQVATARDNKEIQQEKA